MSAIQTSADLVYSDFKTPGVPATGLKTATKAEIRGLFALIDDEVSDLQTELADLELAADSVSKATWSALNAIVGTRNGQGGLVTAGDGGTHTDPVVGGTVNNAGQYSWSTSPAGWQRIGDLPPTVADLEALEAEFVAATEALNDIQTIGAATPVSASSASHTTFLFGEAIENDGFLSNISVYGINGGGDIKIKIFDPPSGNTWTQNGSDHTVSISTGLHDYPLSIAVTAGQYWGFFGGGTNGTNQKVGATAVSGAPWYSSGTSDGNQTTVTDSTVSSASRLEIHADFTFLYVDTASVKEIRTDLDDAISRVEQIEEKLGKTIVEANIGMQTDPVSGAGASATNGYYVFGKPADYYGEIVGMQIAPAASGDIEIGMFTRNGSGLTEPVTTLTTVSVTTGSLNTITLPTPIEIQPGWFYGIHTVSGIMPTVAGAADQGGWYFGTTQSFTDTAVQSNFQLLVQFNIEKVDYGDILGAPTVPNADGTIPAYYIPWYRTRICHVIAYGQSNSVGAKQAAFSLVASAYHLTFNVGPKMTQPGIAGGNNPDDLAGLKPLVEDDAVPKTGAIYGETFATGFTRQFSAYASARGTPPVFLASAAGLTSTPIEQLTPGNFWYENLRYHVTAGKREADALNRTYSVPAVDMNEGEANIIASTSQASVEASIDLLVDTFNDDVKAIVGDDQVQPVIFFWTVPASGLTSGGDGYLEAVFAKCETRLDCHFVCPEYHFPYIDGVHLTNVGQIWRGKYVARAQFQASQGRIPDCAKFLGANANGTALTAYISAPTAIALNTTIVGSATDWGIKVVDDTGTLTLSGKAIGTAVLDETTGRYITPITMTLNRSLGNNPKFRYAKDFGNSGSTISSGAGGNLFDTTTETTVINSTTYSMAHPVRPCTLSIYVLE